MLSTLPSFYMTLMFVIIAALSLSMWSLMGTQIKPSMRFVSMSLRYVKFSLSVQDKKHLYFRILHAHLGLDCRIIDWYTGMNRLCDFAYAYWTFYSMSPPALHDDQPYHFPHFMNTIRVAMITALCLQTQCHSQNMILPVSFTKTNQGTMYFLTSMNANYQASPQPRRSFPFS